jgi:hypothetical protein
MENGGASRAPRPARSKGRTGRRTSALRINRTSVQIKNTDKKNDEVNGVRDGSAGLLTVFPEARGGAREDSLATLSPAPTRAPSRRQRARRRGERVGVEPVNGELQFWMHKCLS